MVKSNRGKPVSVVNKLLIWSRAAGRCQFENCPEELDQDLISGNFTINAAYIAHIVASSPDGPRGDLAMSPRLSNDVTNLMLMCDRHHRVIDGPETKSQFTVERLKAMKKAHEDWVRMALSSGPDRSSHILRFSASIDQNETSIPFDQCVEAILPVRYPANREGIEIKIRGMRFKDSDPDYWTVQPRMLREDFARRVQGAFETGQIRHISVFALAPIPLLIDLGRMLPDHLDIEIFQAHREPVQQWKWANDSNDVSFEVLRPDIKISNKVALKFSISAVIDDSRITEAIGENVSIWEIRSSDPRLDRIRSKADLSRFRSTARDVFNEIRERHGRSIDLSVFPAIPVSCAVEIGRVWQPKAHPDLRVFDEIKNVGFVERLVIRG